MKKLLLLTLVLCFTISTSQATNIADLKTQTAELYQAKIKDYPNIALTEQRFGEVITNPENKDKLTELYKGRIEFLSDEHKLKRNEYLSKSLINFTKKAFSYMYDPKREDMVKYRQKSLANFNRYLYEVSNLDQSFDDMLHVFSAINGSGQNNVLYLFTPQRLLMCNEMSGECDLFYNKDFEDQELHTLYKQLKNMYVFKQNEAYSILYLGKDKGFAQSLSLEDVNDFIHNIGSIELEPGSELYNPVVSLLKYKNQKSGVEFQLDYLFVSK